MGFSSFNEELGMEIIFRADKKCRDKLNIQSQLFQFPDSLLGKWNDGKILNLFFIEVTNRILFLIKE